MDKSTQWVIPKYPISMISFQPGTDMRQVLQLHKLCHCIIRWEKFKNSRPVRQCFNCQSFGHSSNFSSRPPKCVKRDQHHASKNCTKPASSPPKCVNCGDNHPPTTASGSQHEDKQPTIPISTVTVPCTEDFSTFIITPTNMGSSCNPDVNQYHSSTHQFGIWIYKSHYGHVQPPNTKHADVSVSN